MLKFKKVELDDIYLLRPLFPRQNSRICDYTVNGVALWRDYFDIEFTVFDNTIIFMEKSVYGSTAFTFPFGDNVDGAIDQTIAFCGANNMPAEFCNVPEAGYRHLLKRFPRAVGSCTRDWCEYLYNSADLISLSGKKYSGQRNHINRFKANYDYSFNEITAQNAGMVKSAFNGIVINAPDLSGFIAEEEVKVNELLDNYDTYAMLGGFISVKDEIVALSIGDIVNDTLFVHIERANTDYHGSYQMIVNEFAAHYATGGVRYINREEDMGIEGLRTSKMSYHPCCLLKKYVVRVD